MPSVVNKKTTSGIIFSSLSLNKNQTQKRNKVKENKLDHIAKAVLKNYKQNFTSVKFHTKATSTLYQVIDDQSQKLALKIYDDASSNIEDNQIEIQLLEAIQKKGTLSIATLIPNKDGQSFTRYHDEKSNATYRIVLSKWLEGTDLKGHENEALFFQLGQMLAELHKITKDLILPENLKPKKWDQVFYFRDEVAVYHDPKYSDVVTEEFKNLLDKAIPLFDNRLQALYAKAPAQLLHGDVNPWNVKLHKQQLALLDFEDVTLGQPIHDLAILLFYYRDKKEFDYADVKKWVLDGYASVCELPEVTEADLLFLDMARTVNLMNWVLTLEKDYEEFFEKGVERLKKNMKNF